MYNWGEKALSGAIVELGKKMLHLKTAPDSANTMTSLHAAAAIATANTAGQAPSKTKKKQLKPKVKGAKVKSLDKELMSSHEGQNEELKSLEAYITKLSQKGGFVNYSGSVRVSLLGFLCTQSFSVSCNKGNP